MVTAGSTTRFILDGVQVIEEYDGSGAWQARYLYEDGIDRPRAMDRADIADVNGNANTTEVLRFHYHQQALGSVTEISQPTGAVVEWVTYDVYGAATIRDRLGATVTSSAVGNPWLFTGREFDPESGLYHYRARAYDAVAGRFLQRDPLEYLDGLALLAYCRERPAGLTDPHGTASQDLVKLKPGTYKLTADGASASDSVEVTNSSMDVSEKGGEDGASAVGLQAAGYGIVEGDNRAEGGLADTLFSSISGELKNALVDLLLDGVLKSIKSALAGLLGKIPRCAVVYYSVHPDPEEEGNFVVEVLKFKGDPNMALGSEGTYVKQTIKVEVTTENGEKKAKAGKPVESKGTWKKAG